MTRTVDLVISGDGRAARADGCRCPPVRGASAHRLAWRRCATGAATSEMACARRRARIPVRSAVMSSAEVVCVDGIDAVEAVIVRHTPTGRLSAVNASAFVSFDAQS